MVLLIPTSLYYIKNIFTTPIFSKQNTDHINSFGQYLTNFSLIFVI